MTTRMFGGLGRRRGARAVVTGAGLLLEQACAEPEFGHLEVEQRSSAPLTVEVDDDLVTIPIGIAARLKVKPVSKGSDRYSSHDELRFETDNGSVMEAFQIDDTSQVVITGVRLGGTCLRVIVNDNQVDCLRVEVVNQAGVERGDQ